MGNAGDDLDGLRVGEFVRRKRYSLRGHAFYVWESADVPAIKREYLECVVYLYPTPEAARDGVRAGGSGFLVGVQAKDGHVYCYIATNRHVIEQPEHPGGEARVARLNTEDSIDVLDLRGEAWYTHSDGDDVAVCPVEVPAEYHYKAILTDLFLTEHIITTHRIGPGDDVFLAGRFVSHEGKQQNDPSVRFGHIAQMPGEPILQERTITTADGKREQFAQVSFLAQIQSIGGFSGSPVFLFPTKDRTGVGLPIVQPWLVGINWGHLQEREPVHEKDATTGRLTTSKTRFVYSHTGIAGVVPAWKLQELLDIKPLAALREAEDACREQERNLGGAQMDTQSGA